MRVRATASASELVRWKHLTTEVEVFQRVGVDIRPVDLGVRSNYRTVFRPAGSIQSKHFAPQTQTTTT
jgi:hypothetical protein